MIFNSFNYFFYCNNNVTYNTILTYTSNITYNSKIAYKTLTLLVILTFLTVLTKLISLEIIMYIVTILAEELICTCPKSNLALQKELFDIQAQHFLIYYLVARKRQRHFLLLKS